MSSFRAKFISPLKEFIHDSRAVGITLIICTIVSLLISNSTWGETYIHFWDRAFTFSISQLHLPHTPLHIINDALMTVFFLLVGLEIKRELLIGELSSIKNSLLPVIAAIGGMIVPAGIYYLWCGQTHYSNGWAIPMATDIAFSLGILSLLGRKAPLSFRIFLTALAIIDDLGGILTIAIFYAGEINWMYLSSAMGLLLLLGLMNLLKIKKYYFYLLLGVIMWYLIFNSGVHATIAGVLLALTIPLHKIEQLEHALHDPVNFIILPLFALANTAILFPSDFTGIFSSPLYYGIFTGLVLGKPLGIFLFSFIAVKLNWASLPKYMNFKNLFGIGIIAGIGFTMSIFITTLAFPDPKIQLVAKIAIIAASAIAGLAGFFYLKFLNLKKLP